MKAKMKTVLCCCTAILATAIYQSRAGAQDADRGAQVFKQLDVNGDGRITPDEFSIARALEALDGDGDGAITAAEAREYTLEDGSTKKVSTDDNANYIYPHGEATPK
jgi:Ca2+-binding EF-hand superfamily protein